MIAIGVKEVTMVDKTKTYQELTEAIIKGKRDAVEPLIRRLLSDGLGPEEIMNDTMIPAMDVVGEQFSRNEIFLPEMMIAARAMNIGLDILRPMLIAKGVSSRGKVIIGTAKGDIHDVGKNIVSMVLQGAGYEVMDLGIDVPPEKFIGAINQYQPKFVLMSALITLTMSMMEETIKALKKAGVRDKVKVGVGGAPLTQSFADRIGADFYGKDARAAVIKCNELIKR
jgi:5-methyltetrahydrofolate--homocysteine methyltransferase